MSVSLATRIKQFLKTLEPLQDSMLSLFERRRNAVTAADTDEMLRLAEVEAELSRKLQETLGARREILFEAKRAGISAPSIGELVAALEEADREGLLPRIRAAKQKSERIRRESWVQWIISQRANCYYRELLELIAHKGKKSPVYGDGPGMPSTGGALLDASA